MPALDARVVAAARSLLADDGPARLARFDAGAGEPGTVVFLDPLRDSDFDIVLFGAGHVARALVGVLAGLACRVTWVDERESEFPAVVPANVNRGCHGHAGRGGRRRVERARISWS